MFDRHYFEESSIRDAPPYTLEKIYPRMLNIAQYFNAKYSPKRILDAGCAKGFLVKAFLDINVNAYGLDVSTYALVKAPLEIKDRLVLGSAEKLPFSNKSFDFVFAIDLVEHLAKPENFILEINRILVEKGKACIFTIGRKNPNASKDSTHINVHSAKYWYKLFKKCGFKSARLYYQVGYPHIKNAPYKISRKLKIQPLTQLLSIIKLNFKILHEQEYTFLLTKVKDVAYENRLLP